MICNTNKCVGLISSGNITAAFVCSNNSKADSMYLINNTDAHIDYYITNSCNINYNALDSSTKIITHNGAVTYRVNNIYNEDKYLVGN